MNFDDRIYCKRCIMYSPGRNDKVKHEISFNDQGICNICSMHDKFEKNFTINGESKLAKIIEEVREDGKNKQYDCILGISGGCDSSYFKVCNSWVHHSQQSPTFLNWQSE